MTILGSSNTTGMKMRVYHDVNAPEYEAIPFDSKGGTGTVCTKFGTARVHSCKGCKRRPLCLTKYLRSRGVDV